MPNVTHITITTGGRSITVHSVNGALIQVGMILHSGGDVALTVVQRIEPGPEAAAHPGSGPEAD